MNVHIRPFTATDYETLAQLYTANNPDNPTSAEEMRFNDEHTDPKCYLRRWVAERDGMAVGVAVVAQSAGMYHPRKFFVNGSVHPEYQRQGIGSALYGHLLEELAAFDPIMLRASAREDKTHSVHFLHQHGFREEMRAWESRLDVTAFDPTPSIHAEDRMRADGIEIKTLRELESDPERNHKLHALYNELDQDVPSPDPITPVDFEHFDENFFGRPTLLPDANFVAVHHGAYVGTSALWSSAADNYLWTGLTGVKRSYRRKGIALALKLRGIAYAQAHNHPVIVTDNESNNRPMLSINERLGYRKQPAWIMFANTLKPEDV